VVTPVPIVQDILATIGWTFLGIVLFYSGVRLFDLFDPIDYQAEIRRGNIAAGVLLAAVILSVAAIIITMILT
jgi:uncharacterized membrane protein YjfL (UPF0719 family)